MSVFEVIVVVVATLLAAVMGGVAVKLIDRLRRKDAETEVQNILERAAQDVSNRRREAELEIKEAEIKQKAAADQELFRGREELREKERTLDKRQELLEQQTEDLRTKQKSKIKPYQNLKSWIR